jgi:ABC-type lipoprotein release transport system permease subunit
MALRRREIAIRLALGAGPAGLRRRLVLEGMRPALLGAALGSAGALLLAPALTSWLYDVSPLDPAVLAAVALTLLAVAALASWIPVRRAASVDPALTLRAE